MSTPDSPIPLAHLNVTAADGLSEVQARMIWHAVVEVRAGRFDALAVHAELVAAGYTPAEADVLIEEMVKRLAELAA